MRKPDIEISQADGNPMKIKGMIKLPVKVGRMWTFHNYLCDPQPLWGSDLGGGLATLP